jgi:3-hydroxyisobutyrate dehydrogenase
MSRVGWIGLGVMGLPMAGNVARAGHDVTAYDIDPGRAASLADDGVKPATSISQAATGAEVLVLMVATPAQVDGVLFGEDPATSSLGPGAVVMIMATVGPAAVQRWAERLGQQQVEVVDAPVSGARPRATFLSWSAVRILRCSGYSRSSTRWQVTRLSWDQHPVTVRR